MSFADKPQWIRHESWLTPDGQSQCKFCGLELPRLVPVNQVLCQKDDRLYIGEIDGARRCK